MKFTFNVLESLKKSWNLYKENFNGMIVLILITFAIQLLSQIVSRGNRNMLLVLILSIANIFISYLWIRAINNLLDNKGFNPFSQDVLPKFFQIWDFFKTGILSILCLLPLMIFPVIAIGIAVYGIVLSKIYIIIISAFLFIVLLLPAIYLSSRLFAAKYLSVEKSQGARKNIIESWKMTKGIGWVIVWKILLIGLFISLGLVALIIGVFITYPVGMIALVMMYRELAKQNKGEVMAPVTESTNSILTENLAKEEKKEDIVPEENK